MPLVLQGVTGIAWETCYCEANDAGPCGFVLLHASDWLMQLWFASNLHVLRGTSSSHVHHNQGVVFTTTKIVHSDALGHDYPSIMRWHAIENHPSTH